MATMKRSDLQYEYTWTHYGSDDPKVSGSPDSTMLNRNEGYEMLYFINKCAELWNWQGDTLPSMKKLETIIKTRVPTDIRTQREIKAWIEKNYQTI